jgi:hypothetical protein
LEFHSEHYDALLQLEQNETPFGSPNPSLCPSLASSMSITIDGSEDDEDSGLDDYTIGQNEEDEETPTYLPCETIEEDLQELAKQEHIGHPEQRLYFPEDKFVGMEPEIVDKIPDDIDGKKYYKILNVDAKTWIAKQRDRRNFIMTTSSQVDLKGKRKVGWCRGSLKCTNPDCVFVRMATQRNSHNFSKKHGDKTKRCFSCGMKGVEVQCFARKLTVYDENTQELHVKHINNHSCALKQDYTKTDQAMRELIKRNPSLSAGELARKSVIDCIRRGKLDEAQTQAEQVANTRRFQYLKKKYRKETDVYSTSEQSWNAMIIMREAAQKVDPFFLYRMNFKGMNEQPTYVWKSHRDAIKIAAMMDVDMEGDNPMKDEEVFFDAMHSRVRGYKTFSLFVCIRPARLLIRLATMETEQENHVSVRLFFEILNEAIAEYTKGKQKQFNPKGILCDAHGANYIGAFEVFGAKFLDKVKSCQWHYLHNMYEYATKIPDKRVRQVFKETCKRQLKATTATAYDLLHAKLAKIAFLYTVVHGFVEFWDIRRYHVFSAFRGDHFKRSNQAEIGQAALRPRTGPIKWMNEAAEDDIATFMLQMTLIAQFLRGEVASQGQCPSQKDLIADMHAAQERRAKEWAQIALNPTALQSEIDASVHPDVHVPGRREKHKPKDPTKDQPKDKKRGKNKPDNEPDPTLQEAQEAMDRYYSSLREKSQTKEVTKDRKEKKKGRKKTNKEQDQSDDSPSDVELDHPKKPKEKKKGKKKTNKDLDPWDSSDFEELGIVKNQRKKPKEKKKGKGKKKQDNQPDAVDNHNQPDAMLQDNDPSSDFEVVDVELEERLARLKEIIHGPKTKPRPPPRPVKVPDKGVAAKVRGTSSQPVFVGEPADEIQDVHPILSQPTGRPISRRPRVSWPKDPQTGRDMSFESNPPTIVLYRGIIHICSGCRVPFDKRIGKTEPHDLIFSCNAVKSWYDNNLELRSSLNTCYFHFNLKCLKILHPKLEGRHVYISDDLFRNLKDEHLRYIHYMGFGEAIANKFPQ